MTMTGRSRLTAGDRNALARVRSEFDGYFTFAVSPSLRLLYVDSATLTPRESACIAALSRGGWHAASVHQYLLGMGEWDPE